MNNLSTVRGAVTLLTVITAAIHAYLAYEMGAMGLMFWLNAAGYLALLAVLLYVKLPFLAGRERLLHYALLGFTTVTSSFNSGTNTIIFDELGGPVSAAGGTTPAGTTDIDLRGSNSNWRITIEAYTGRVTITELP